MPCHFDVWFYPIKKQCKIKIADKNAHFYYTKRTMDDGRPFAYLEYGELIGYNAKNRPEDLNAVLKFIKALKQFIASSTATPPEPTEEGTPISTLITTHPNAFSHRPTSQGAESRGFCNGGLRATRTST